MGAPSDSDYFKRYYAERKEAFNEKRRKRYAEDQALRDKAVQRQRKYRQQKTRPSTKGQAQFRKVNEQLQQVFRISAAADMVGCSVEWIRKYEKALVIPRPSVVSAQRYYTAPQVALIKGLYDLMVQLKFSKDSSLKALALQHQKHHISTNWTGE